MKTFQTIGFTGLLALVLLAGATTVLGEIKNFSFQGVITSLDDPASLLDASVTNGAPIEGFYLFDSNVPAPDPGATVGDYWYTNRAYGIFIKIGPTFFRTNPRQVSFLIEVIDRPDSDHYLLRSHNNLCSEPLFVESISWQLDDSTGTALQDAALLLTPPDLDDFTSVFGLNISGGDMPYSIRGMIQSIAEVPALIQDPPDTTIGSSVEVRWPSQLGYFYQIQKSIDLETWSDVGNPILGDGSVMSMFFATQPNLQETYRVAIANFSE